MSSNDGWEDISDELKSNNSGWEDVSHELNSKPSILQTIAGKVSNGASLGFVDELAGGMEALGQAAGIKGLGGKFKDVGLTDDGPTLDSDKLLNAYRSARDKERNLQDEMTNTHPVVSGVSDLAGGIATIPATGAATLTGRVAAAAGLGAVAGLGSSQADLTKGDITGAAKDTAIGGALGGALQYGGEKIVAPVLSKMGNYISESGPAKFLGKTMASVSPENTERYLNRPNQVNKALEMEDIGQYFKDDAMEQFQNHLGKLDSEAWKSLSTNPTLNKSDILQLGDDFISQILAGKTGQLTRVEGTGADADIINAIRNQLSEIKNAYGNSLSESDLKSVVQSMQKLGWSLEGSPRTSIQGQALQQLSGLFNDTLKQVNPEYAQKMIPVQEATSTLKSLERKFINNNAPDSIDRFLLTAKKFGSLSDESEAMQAVRGLDKATGADIENMVKDRLTANSFDKSDANGSRKTLLGKALGAAVGGTLGYTEFGDKTGAALGAVAGFSMDKYAGQVFKQILNGQIAATTGIQKMAPYLGKFAQPLMDAASRGNEAVAATHFILQQSYPEYRKMTQGQDK